MNDDKATPRRRRRVVQAHMREGRGSLLGGDTWRRVRWYDLTLDCGHLVQRKVRYTPSTSDYRLAQRSRDDALPPPTRALCNDCPAHPGGTP